ncbi:MAG: pectinesterase family protein, partial [Candidatus Bathyarchaeota archaeon]|nr:pectinesterase family protein [Candidatus Bathyarchaeota archaeon]
MRIRLSLLMVSVLLLASVLTWKSNIQPANAESTTWIVDDDGPADFHTIQEAVTAASAGDTIFVNAGLYVESVTIDKALTLVGEDRDAVIVTTNETLGPYIFTIEIGAVPRISGFTFLGNLSIPTAGIGGECRTIVNNRFLYHFSGIYGLGRNVSDNIFTDNYRGITLGGTYPQVVTNNEFIGNSVGVLFSLFLSNATVSDNVFHNNYWGIGSFYFSDVENTTTISNNIFTFNDEGVAFGDAYDVSVSAYHNDFINNSIQARGAGIAASTWDDGYPSGGNYWSNYNGTDLYSGQYQNVSGCDEIGDMPYVLNLNHTDHYPLMRPYQYMLGDVNRDGKVRIDDILTIALAFGSDHD